MRLAFAVGLLGFALAVALAAIFSGSVLAPIFAMPIAAGTGMAAAILAIRAEDRERERRRR